MIQFNIKSKLNFPDFDLTKELNFIAQRIIIPDIAGHIQQGQDISGMGYAPLDPKTIKAKGHANPLIGKERRLFSASTYHAIGAGKNKILIRLNTIRATVGKYLQIEGVKTRAGKRFFNFFGVSREAEKESIEVIDNKIRELTSGR